MKTIKSINDVGGISGINSCPARQLRFMRSVVFTLCLISTLFALSANNIQAQTTSMTKISEGDTWHYFKGIQDPPKKWINIGFDHNNWLQGPVGIGYGAGNNRTYLGDMQGKYLNVYARREFYINNINDVQGMALSLKCDGPFTVYLNEIMVKRIKRGIPLPQGFRMDLSGFNHELLPGKNILSIKCSNDDINSADFSFMPEFIVVNREARK